MGLFSIFQKNKQEGAGQDSGYYSKADDGATLERARSKRASSAEGVAARRTRSGRESDDPVLPEKKRARRRLVGAIALALTVAVGLPMLLDSEPKPLASDIAIQIPSKEKPAEPAPEARAPESRVAADEALDKSEEIVKDAPPAKPGAPAPAAAPALAAAPATKPAPLDIHPAAPAVTEKKPAVTAAPHVAELKLHEPPKPKEPVKDAGKDAAREAAKLAETRAAEVKAAEAKAAEARLAKLAKEAKEAKEAKLEARKTEPHAEAKKPEPETKPVKAVDAARAMAILEDKPSDTRYMVQVAAVTSQEKVDELQGKLKEAGIQSFTQKVTTANGALTRIRVGPFANKEEAEKVRAKLGKIGLSSSLATS
ncbi:SPOR domain-containing protein [Pseudoduganella namucuonensis]|uniref:DedD protein n=1 Tax=Pseudoduganella namucuonensis TaxID=1035707 RepID=A0A1I7IV41_9BURK|nr:SPOR domain-containing protein [Pseudoduganella namucuonensis]SFU76768.1 DedD protein [Pseudoduganella namucuonensis]